MKWKVKVSTLNSCREMIFINEYEKDIYINNILERPYKEFLIKRENQNVVSYTLPCDSIIELEIETI